MWGVGHGHLDDITAAHMRIAVMICFEFFQHCTQIHRAADAHAVVFQPSASVHIDGCMCVCQYFECTYVHMSI